MAQMEEHLEEERRRQGVCVRGESLPWDEPGVLIATSCGDLGDDVSSSLKEALRGRRPPGSTSPILTLPLERWAADVELHGLAGVAEPGSCARVPMVLLLLDEGQDEAVRHIIAKACSGDGAELPCLLEETEDWAVTAVQYNPTIFMGAELGRMPFEAVTGLTVWTLVICGRREQDLAHAVRWLEDEGFDSNVQRPDFVRHGVEAGRQTLQAQEQEGARR